MLSLPEQRYITFVSNRRKVVLNVGHVLYVLMDGNNAIIHVSNGQVYKTRMTFGDVAEKLGDGFLHIHRGGIVSVRAIHDITDKIHLNNGETLIYTLRKKKEILEKFHAAQKQIISGFDQTGIPDTEEEYRRHYSSFETLPFAFTDIELIFNDEMHATDWIFRYGNPALATLEKVPLEQLIGHSFGSVFPNMDSKWLRSYERATLYRETMEIIDYSPEIDTYLKVICFPTFKGHCGCILFNISDIRFAKSSNDAEKALQLYLGTLSQNNQ